ncbi:MAG: hypothetical protein ACFFD2_18105 [Promethearchaeota archaeon]
MDCISPQHLEVDGKKILKDAAPTRKFSSTPEREWLSISGKNNKFIHNSKSTEEGKKKRN